MLLYAGSSSILATEAVVPEVPVPGAMLTVLSGFTVSTTKTPARSPSNDSDALAPTVDMYLVVLIDRGAVGCAK